MAFMTHASRFVPKQKTPTGFAPVGALRRSALFRQTVIYYSLLRYSSLTVAVNLQIEPQSSRVHSGIPPGPTISRWPT